MFHNYFSCALLFFALFVSSSKAANILAVVPTPSYSHQVAFTPLWRELSLRRHQVTLVTTDSINDPKLTNLTEINIKWAYQLFANISKMAEDDFSPWNFHSTVFNLVHGVSLKQTSHRAVQDLIQDRSVQYDVVLVEFVFPEYLALAELHNCPKIIFSSLDAFIYFHQMFGNSIHPVLYPDMGLDFNVARNFKERLISTLFTWRALYYFGNVIYKARDRIVRDNFNVTTKIEDLIHGADLLLLNVNPVLQNIRAVGPTTISVGDLRKPSRVKALPVVLKEFLDDAKDGFIYFSLGSNVKSKELKKESLNAIVQALGEMPYKVLWKFEDDHLPGKPQNVKLVKWTPQQAVLAHPNIKLFVTQGGLQSMEEGIYAEVPFVVIPFFADQDQNAHLMQQKGIAVVVDRFPHIEEKELKTAMLEVLNNPIYGNAVKRLKQLAMDTPMTGLEKAVWWIEYVIRHKGAKHLRNPAADLPFYQYYLIDVIGLLFTITAIVLTVIFILVRKFIRKFKAIVANRVLKSKKSQ